MASTFGGMTLAETRAPAGRGGKAISWVAGFLAVAVVVAGGVAAAYVLHDDGSLLAGGGDDNPGGAAPGIAPPVAQSDDGEPAPAPEPAKAAAPAVAGGTGFDLLVSPAGAEVSLDGKAIGSAPLRVRSVAPGRHTLDVTAPDGYFGHHMEIDLADGKAEVIKIELARVDAIAPAPLAEADDAEEKADDEADDESASPGRETRLERRDRRRAERREARNEKQPSRDGDSEADDEDSHDKGGDSGDGADEPRRAPRGATGTLMVGSKPPCDIYINGKKTGLKTPQRSMVLPAGVHTLRLVSKEHGLDKRFKVRVAEDKTTRAIQDFTGDL